MFLTDNDNDCHLGGMDDSQRTCWALTPSDDANRDQGCSGTGWAGDGIYYAGHGRPGAFVGPARS